MKFDLNKQLVSLDGTLATQTIANGYNPDGSPKELKEIPLTVGLVLKSALNYQGKDGKLELDDAVKRGKWIMSIQQNVCPDFKVEEQAKIKQLVVDAGFSPIIIAQIDEIIEKKGR